MCEGGGRGDSSIGVRDLGRVEEYPLFMPKDLQIRAVHCSPD